MYLKLWLQEQFWLSLKVHTNLKYRIITAKTLCSQASKEKIKANSTNEKRYKKLQHIKGLAPNRDTFCPAPRQKQFLDGISREKKFGKKKLHVKLVLFCA